MSQTVFDAPQLRMYIHICVLTRPRRAQSLSSTHWQQENDPQLQKWGVYRDVNGEI